MAENCMISVIVPAFNVEKFIEKCLKSILSQQYENIELIVVDDGSTDFTGTICDNIASLDSRVRVIHKKNAGVSEARNTGIQLANGKYLTFVDGDDWIDAEMLSHMMEAMDENVDVVFCRPVLEYTDNSQCLCFEENLAALCEKPYDLGNVFFAEKYQMQGNTLRRDNVAGYVWRTLFRKQIIDYFSLTFDKRICFSEDILFLTEYLSHCTCGKLVDKYLYHYLKGRNESASEVLSKGYQSNLFESRKRLLEEEIKIIENSSELSLKYKHDLIVYLKYRFSMLIAENELLFNNIGSVEKLSQLYKDKFLRMCISLESFRVMIDKKYAFKEMLRYFLVWIKAWKVLGRYYSKRLSKA